MIELPNHIGWGDNRFSVVFYVCTFANHVHSYAVFYIGVGVCIPISITFFAYLGIYLKVKDSNLVRNRLLSGGERVVSREERAMKKLNRRIFRQNVKVARVLFRVYVIFLVMWLPVAVIILLGKGLAISPVWYILTILLAHGNSSINCIVYGASMDSFREGYLRILGFGKQYENCCSGRSICRNSRILSPDAGISSTKNDLGEAIELTDVGGNSSITNLIRSDRTDK